MQRRQRINHRFADLPAKWQSIFNLARHLAANDQPAPPLHQVKWHADDGGVFAKQIGLRREIEDRMDGRKQAILARHIVRRRCDRAERRAAQDEFAVAQANQVSQI